MWWLICSVSTTCYGTLRWSPQMTQSQHRPKDGETLSWWFDFPQKPLGAVLLTSASSGLGAHAQIQQTIHKSLTLITAIAWVVNVENRAKKGSIFFCMLMPDSDLNMKPWFNDGSMRQSMWLVYCTFHFVCDGRSFLILGTGLDKN